MNTLMFPDLTVKPTDKVVFRIYYADNLVTISSNHTMLYSRRTEGMPRLNDEVELTRTLRDGLNFINISCIDWGGRSRFHVELELNGNKLPDYVINIDRNGSHGLINHRGIIVRKLKA